MSQIDEATKLAIEAVAKAKVAEALGGDVIAKLVDEVMRHTDRTSSYGTEKKSFFDKIVRECLEVAIRQAVVEAISKNDAVQEKIKQAIRDHAEKFTVTIMDALSQGDWRCSMAIKFGSE